jgi:hypothetical protein
MTIELKKRDATAEKYKSEASKPMQEETDASKQEAPAGVQTVEPEDAHLTGGSKSHQRRVLGLNVDDEAGQAQRHPETSAGQHATGSFTNKAADETNFNRSEN